MLHSKIPEAAWPLPAQSPFPGIEGFTLSGNWLSACHLTMPPQERCHHYPLKRAVKRALREGEINNFSPPAISFQAFASQKGQGSKEQLVGQTLGRTLLTFAWESRLKESQKGHKMINGASSLLLVSNQAAKSWQREESLTPKMLQ